jgi:hypothetical protein
MTDVVTVGRAKRDPSGLDARRRKATTIALQQRFGGRLPSPAELLAADPQVLRGSGLSARITPAHGAGWSRSTPPDREELTHPTIISSD